MVRHCLPKMSCKLQSVAPKPAMAQRTRDAGCLSPPRSNFHGFSEIPLGAVEQSLGDVRTGLCCRNDAPTYHSRPLTAADRDADWGCSQRAHLCQKNVTDRAMRRAEHARASAPEIVAL